MFDEPARAVRSAQAIIDQLKDVGVHIRAGVLTAEIEVTDGDVRGLGVHVAARIMAAAASDEVLVSSVVTDLTVGSSLAHTDRGSTG